MNGYDQKQLDDFYKAAHLDDSYRKWKKDRREPSIFADVLIVDSNPNYWYAPFIGMEVFAELWFRNWQPDGLSYLYSAYAVYLTGTLLIRGRSIGPEHIIIL